MQAESDVVIVVAIEFHGNKFVIANPGTPGCMYSSRFDTVCPQIQAGGLLIIEYNIVQALGHGAVFSGNIGLFGRLFRQIIIGNEQTGWNSDKKDNDRRPKGLFIRILYKRDTLTNKKQNRHQPKSNQGGSGIQNDNGGSSEQQSCQSEQY